MRAARAQRSYFALAAVATPSSIPVLSRVALVLALRARAGRLHRPDCALRATRAMRTQTPITCAPFPNEFLYQFGVQSVQTLGRQCWIGGAVRMFARASMRTRDRRPPLLLPIVPISVCTNVGPDRRSRLAAYAVCVVLCARLRALRAHQCTLAIADRPIFIALSQ
jgi:hypothetical protein